MKERWQKQREKERTGRRRKKISAHWAKLFVLGKHCNEKCEYWWDNRECYITLYEEEARKLIESLNGFNLKLDLIDWLRNKSGSKSYQAIFNYLGQTHLCDMWIHTPYQLVAVFHQFVVCQQPRRRSSRRLLRSWEQEVEQRQQRLC